MSKEAGKAPTPPTASSLFECRGTCRRSFWFVNRTPVKFCPFCGSPGLSENIRIPVADVEATGAEGS